MRPHAQSCVAGDRETEEIERCRVKFTIDAPKTRPIMEYGKRSCIKGDFEQMGGKAGRDHRQNDTVVA